jgi:hypothetical protein
MAAPKSHKLLLRFYRNLRASVADQDVKQLGWPVRLRCDEYIDNGLSEHLHSVIYPVIDVLEESADPAVLELIDG